MPYDVSGWVEIAWGDVIVENQIEWCATLCLDRFMLGSDYLSGFLFGLSKLPPDDALFANRGVPADCSELVSNSINKNDQFVKKYGEGDFRHTHASWSEIYPFIQEIPSERIKDSEWNIVFALIKELESSGFSPEDIRFIVWGIGKGCL